MSIIHQRLNTFHASTFSAQGQSQPTERASKNQAASQNANQNNASSQQSIPKALSLRGKPYSIGALKGRADPVKRNYLSAALNPGKDVEVSRNDKGDYCYNVHTDMPEAGPQHLQVSASVNDRDELAAVEVHNNDDGKLLVRAEFDGTAARTGENALQLGKPQIAIPAGAIFHGGPLPRHPDGERYQTMNYIRPGTAEPVALMGLRHPGGHVFEVFDGSSHQSVGKLSIVSSSQSGRGDSEVLVDPDRAQLRGGMRHLKRSAEGVKTSKSSPTGYKLASTGQPCDRHGRVVAGSSSSAASASASAAQPANTLTQIVSRHISLPMSQRANSEYANLIRQSLHGNGSPEHIRAHNTVYGEMAGIPMPATQVLENVIPGLDINNPDEARLSGYLGQLYMQAAAGQHISLPAYYHCTGDESFDSMMSSEHPRVKVATPRTGTGGAGAWLSTSPETRAYGPYIMAFNHHLDLIHSTTSNTQGRASVRTVGSDLHIGIQESISLNGRNSGIAEPPLSLIGVPAAEVEFYKSSVGRLNGNLHFSSADGGTDVAVFSSETVQKLALLLNQLNAKKVPQGW